MHLISDATQRNKAACLLHFSPRADSAYGKSSSPRDIDVTERPSAVSCQTYSRGAEWGSKLLCLYCNQ